MEENTNMSKTFIGKFLAKGCTKERTGVCNCNVPKATEGMATRTSQLSKEQINKSK